MIPLHLSIEGLYSYQGRQEINFSKLTEAQLFGIFGSTGSGKSSILEAITFSLYGQSDRLNQRDNRGYNMMNLRSDRLVIEFRFELHGQEYLFTVNGRRNSRRFEDVKTIERKAYRVEDGSPIPIEDADAESLLGLSYDNFRRTIIVPQGKFQEFLQLTETERTRMMKEIFHLERFELYRKTQVLENRLKSDIDKTTSLINQYAVITPELIGEKETLIQTKQEALEQLRNTLRQSERAFQQQEALQQLFQELVSQTQQVSRLESQLPEIQQRQEQMKAYEQCLLNFKPLLDRKQELLQDQKRIEVQAQQKKESQIGVAQELERKEVQFEKIGQEYHQREQLVHQAEELRKVVQLKKEEENIQALLSRISAGTQKIAELKEEIAGQKQEQITREKDLKGLQDDRPDLQELMPVRDWYQQLGQLQQALTEAEKDLLKVQARKEVLDRNKHQVLSEAAVSSAQFSLPISQLIELLHNRLEEERIKREQLQTQYEHLLAQNNLSGIVEQLEEGKPCPLCGSIHHPMPMVADFSGDQIETVKREQKESEQRLQALQTSLAKLQGAQSQEVQMGQELTDRQKKVQQFQQELDQKRSSFRWSTEMTEDHVRKQLEAINRTDTLIKEIQLQREALRATITDNEGKLDKWQQALEQIRSDHQKVEVAFLSSAKSLKHISYEARKVDSDAAIEELALEYDRNYRGIEESFKSVESQIKQLRSRKDSLSGETKGLEEQNKQLLSQLAQKNLELDTALQQSQFQQLAEVIDLLALSLDIESEKRSIREFEQALHAARTSLSSLQQKTKDKEFSEEAFQQLKEKIEALNQEQSALMIQVGSLQQELKGLQKDLAFRHAQEKELEKLEARGENIKTLKRMFQKSGFVNYVSTMYLQNLCAVANERFMKLTKGGLSLETTDSNSFLVRDYLNNGQTRSAKTLSGGQTFQAALSLALALADQIQSKTASKQNFFFLDEGFGSQDKESLQVIFQTLKSLRQENRIVGIISHVEELQQEISAFLQIKNDLENGSQIKGSWE